MLSSKEKKELHVMRILSNTPDITQRDLSQKLDISLGAVNYVVSSIHDKNYIRVKQFKNIRNRLANRYSLTRKGRLEKRKLLKKLIENKKGEYSILNMEINALTNEYYTDEPKQEED